jgi:hypothetical protein
MSVNDGPPPEMRLFTRPGFDQPLSAEDAERLLAGEGAGPGAPEDQQALAMMLKHAAGPARSRELAGEASAVAAFALVRRQKARRADVPPLGAGGRRRPGAAGGRRRWARPHRGPLVAACAGAAVLIALCGTAVADALPAPVQLLAHDTFGAPAPPPPAPPVITKPGTVPGRQPLPPPTDTPPAKPTSGPGQHGNGRAVGQDPSAKPTPHGVAKGHTKAHGNG